MKYVYYNPNFQMQPLSSSFLLSIYKPEFPPLYGYLKKNIFSLQILSTTL